MTRFKELADDIWDKNPVTSEIIPYNELLTNLLRNKLDVEGMDWGGGIVTVL